MSAQYMTKWYGIHKLQETMASLQVALAQLSMDPHDRKPRRNLVRRVELKMADVMAALQWFEYHNRLDWDCERLERSCEEFDARHLRKVPGMPEQSGMHGIVTVNSLSVDTKPEDGIPSTLPSTDSIPEPESAEVANGSR